MVRVILGAFFILTAVALAGVDGIAWLQDGASGAVRFRSLGQAWFELNSGSLNLAQSVVQRYLWPPLWDPGVTSVLLLPAWLLPGLFGLGLLFWASRAKRDTVVFGKLVK